MRTDQTPRSRGGHRTALGALGHGTRRPGIAAQRSGADRGPGGAQRARACGPGRARRAWPWSWPSCPPSWPSAGRPRLVWWVLRQHALHVVASQHQEHRVEETAGECEVLEGDVEVGVLLVQQAYEAVGGVQDLTPATTDASFSDSTGAPSASRPRSARLYSRSAYSSVISTPPTSNGSSDFSVWRRPRRRVVARTRQCHAVGSWRYGPGHADRLWAGVCSRPASRSPARRTDRG